MVLLIIKRKGGDANVKGKKKPKRKTGKIHEWIDTAIQLGLLIVAVLTLLLR